MSYIKKTDQEKPWAIRTTTIKRIAKDLAIRNIFIIYCEGQNTEPEYFKSFPVNTETKVEAIGLGRSRIALVKKVLEQLSEKGLLKDQNNYDSDRQIWCVFDFDTRGEKGEAEDFNNAIKLAEDNEINVAYSNDSFELWFVLHFQYIDASLTRKEYYKILSKHFGWNYEKNGKTLEMSKSIYGMLFEKIEDALINAQKLSDKYHDDKNQPSNHNPITKVHELVLELRKCLKR